MFGSRVFNIKIALGVDAMPETYIIEVGRHNSTSIRKYMNVMLNLAPCPDHPPPILPFSMAQCATALNSPQSLNLAKHAARRITIEVYEGSASVRGAAVDVGDTYETRRAI